MFLVHCTEARDSKIEASNFLWQTISKLWQHLRLLRSCQCLSTARTDSMSQHAMMMARRFEYIDLWMQRSMRPNVLAGHGMLRPTKLCRWYGYEAPEVIHLREPNL
jgi:hypothetical protein